MAIRLDVTTRLTRFPAASWLAFYGLVLAAWALLFVHSFEIAAGGGVRDLGPGMAWMNDLALAVLGTYRAICFTGTGAGDMSFAGLFLMWGLMAVAMMAPSAVPLLGTYREITRPRDGARAPGAGFWALAGGYIVVWLAFAVVAAAAQQLLADLEVVTRHGLSRSAFFSAGLFAAAGLYQFTPLKQACLTRCRTPMTYFMAYWRDGTAGAIRMGLHHGVICVGCCWALMLLAFAGGAMNLVWMAIAMMLMTAEKLPAGRMITVPLGILLLMGGGVLAMGEMAG